MRRRLAVVLSILGIPACGVVDASITTMVPARGVEPLSIKVLAAKSYAPDIHMDGSMQASERLWVKVPGEMNVRQGSAGTHNLSLRLGKVSCAYDGADAGRKYALNACDDGSGAGAAVLVEGGENILLHVDQGDASAGTTEVEVNLALSRN